MLDDEDISRIRDVVRQELAAVVHVGRRSAAPTDLARDLPRVLVGVAEITTAEALLALGVSPTRSAETQAGAALRDLGWTVRRRGGGARERAYFRPAP